eukprot:g20048.t1
MTLLRVAASDGLHLRHLDVKTAFLNAPVEEDLWVYQAPDFEENDPAVIGKTQPLARNPHGAVYLKSGTQKYQKVVGMLMYMVNTTRWDIAYGVLGLTRGMAAPTEEYLVAARRVLHYLPGTPDLRKVYHKGQLELVGFTDSDFAGELESRRSCTSFLFVLSGGVISAASVPRKTIALSTTEAELIALHGASQEGIYHLNLLRGLGMDIDKFKHFSDAMSALSLSSQAMFSSRTKHDLTTYHLLRESVESGRVLVNQIPTALQLSFLLTKNLPKPKILRLREMSAF